LEVDTLAAAVVRRIVRRPLRVSALALGQALQPQQQILVLAAARETIKAMLIDHQALAGQVWSLLDMLLAASRLLLAAR